MARLRPWILLLGGIGVAFAATSFALLDWRVRTQFGETQWRLPTHVYTQPLELHDGRDIGREAVVRHLEAVGYRRTGDLSAPGRYAMAGAGLAIHTRRFPHADGEEPARRIRVRFSGDGIAAVSTRSGSAALARIEPERIGRVQAGRRADRLPVRLDEVPDALVASLIAVEDRDFPDHWGVQPSAILRALWANLRAGRTVQGGSTLTQQLVKNYFLTGEQTLARKFTEALMALSLEWHYSKGQILEAYLNEVYLGQDGDRAIHGFGLGARFWFNRPLDELQLHEIALLVGLVKGPSYYDPRAHPERARARRDTVLRVLARTGTAPRARVERALGQPLGVVPREAVRLTSYPAYLDLVREQLAAHYSREQLRSGGLRVYTHLDPVVQAAAENALRERLESLDRGGDLQGAVVVTDHGNGRVLALVGDREARRSGYNRALRARRPVGSLIKPAVYLAALRRPEAYTLASRLQDTPLEVTRAGGPTWRPRNYDDAFHGEVALIEALVHSYNVATARLGLDVGLDAVGATLEDLRVAPRRGLVPADLLGSLSMTPVEVARMYQTLAARGFDAPLGTISAVHAADGETLSRAALQVEQTVPPAAVFVVSKALERVTREGTARALERLLPGRSVAGKTGTTDDLRDSWFAGFDGRRTAVVWVGRDDNRPAGLTGAAGALRVWADMMQRLPEAPRRGDAPPGIEWARVDLGTGRSVPGHCRDAPRLPFLEGSIPPRSPRCHGATRTRPGR
jgi:penicillin-binding protein 1B